MCEPSTEHDVRALLAEVVGREAWRVGVTDDRECEFGLDSLAGLCLLAAVEKRFGIRFPDDRLGECRTLKHLLGFIEGP